MALLFTILCGAVALTLGYFINYFAKGHFVHSTQAVIDSEIKYIEALGKIPEYSESRLYIPLDKEAHLPANFPKPSKILTEGLLVFKMPDSQKRYAARIHTFANGEKLLMGTDITDIANDFEFMQWIGIASIAFVMIVVFVSYIISIFVVNGTNKIADTAYDIIRTGDLSRRVDVIGRVQSVDSGFYGGGDIYHMAVGRDQECHHLRHGPAWHDAGDGCHRQDNRVRCRA